MYQSSTGRPSRKTLRAWLHWPALHQRLFPLSSPSTFVLIFTAVRKLNYRSRISPSIYAIFPSISANDGCKQIGNTYSSITTSFAPGELSTIDIGGHSTNVFNFADLPCPPSSIQLSSGETYAPLIAPPSFIWNLDPAFSTCIPGYSQGVDPPTAFPTAAAPGGPGPVGGAPRRRDLEAPPWGPIKTPGPTLKAQL